MSRSRKYPIYKDNDAAGEKKSWKKIFNRKLRRSKKDIPNYGSYKKMNDSWFICDFRFEPDWDNPESVDKASRK